MCARARYSPLSTWKFGTQLLGKQQRYRSVTNTFISKVTSTRTQLFSHRRARARYSPLSAWNTSGDVNLLFQQYNIQLLY